MSSKKFIVTLLLLLIIVICAVHHLSHVDAKREMAVVDEIQEPLLPQKLLSAVIDTENSLAYYGTGTNPGQVCKYNVSSADFSFVSCIAAPSGVNTFYTAVIDVQNSAAYFATGTVPGQVCKYSISPADFSLVSCIAQPLGVGNFWSAVIDPKNSAAYFGTVGGQLCKLNILSTNFVFASCVAALPGVGYFQSAVIDTENSVVYVTGAYFGTNTAPGQVCKYNVSSANFSFVECIAAPSGVNYLKPAVIDMQNSVAYFGQVCKLNISSTNFSFVYCTAAPPGVNSFYSSVIDTQNAVAYFGTGTNPAQVCKYSISSADFSFISCIAAPSEANQFVSGIIDTQNAIAYFGTNTNPGQVCKYNVSSANFSFVCCIAAPPGAINFATAVVDTQNSLVYFGTATNPGQACKYNVSSADFSFVSCIAAPLGANDFATAVIDMQNSAAYFGTYYSPGQVCKYNVSSANFSLVSCIAATPGTDYFRSAVIDTENSVAYFGTSTNPSQVCKFSVSTAVFSLVTCITAPSGTVSFRSAVIDMLNSAAYFGTFTNPGQLCKYNIAPADFSFVSCITAPSGTNAFGSAVIDTPNSVAYIGARTNPGQVCKFNISSTNFSFVSCIAAPVGASYFQSAVIGTQHSVAYFSSYYGQVCKYNISSANFSFEECISVPPGANNFASMVIDTQNNSAAYVGTTNIPGTIAIPSRIVKVDLGAFGCNSDGQLEIGQDDFSRSPNAVVNFVALEGCNVTLSSVDLNQPITFLQSIGSSNITLRNITSTSTSSFVHLAFSTPFSSPSSLITFEENQFEGNRLLASPSDVDLSHSSWSFKCNKWMNGYNNALKTFATQHHAHQLISDCPRTLTASLSPTHNQSESNSESTSLSESQSGSDSTSDSASLTGTSSFSQSASDSLSYSNSLSQSASPSLSTSSTESTSDSHSSSQSESLSSSVTVSDTIYCTNLDEITCNNTLPHQCKFCPTTNICVEVDQRCDSCSVLNEQFCAFTKGRCKFCSEHQVCVNATTTPTCDCVSFSSSACAVANSTCNYCPSESVCVPSQQSCGCINFTSTISLNNSNAFCDASPACHFCPGQQTCLPQSNPCTCHEMNQEQCDVSFLSPQTQNSCKYCSNISVCAPKAIDCLCMALPDQTICNASSGCHWCSGKYNTCAPTHAWPDCDCASLNTSDFCDILSNSKCEWCEKENMCADPDTYKCQCERFTKSMCMTSNCTWCDNMNTCTVEENKKCECYYLRTEERCSSSNSNNKCSWCSSSSQPQSRDGSYTFSTPINDFNYCIDSATDRCECSYLSPAFCEFASSSSSAASSTTTPNFSTSCKFCPNLQLCTHPDNRACECGDEYSVNGCERSPVCSFRQPVLTIEEAVPYCGNNFGRSSAAAGVDQQRCDPVTCEGILDGPSCNASGCDYDAATENCKTTKCFNFFVRGFSPQPFILYFFGLFKDAAVVLLLGAIGDLLTRPIMDIVTKAKGKLKKWTHILPQVSTETLYMSDAIARDGYTFSFSKYVERIQDDTFVFVDDDGETQVLDEQYRLKLFDMTAFCLFDNMLWVKPSDDDEEDEEEEDEDDKEEQDGEKCDAIVTDHHQEQEMKTFSSEKREEEVAVQEEAREESQKPDEGKNRAKDDDNNKITNNDDDDDDTDDKQATFSPRDSKESTPEEQNTDEDKEERKKQAKLSPRASKVPTPELDKAKRKKIMISDDSENEATTPRRSRSATPQPSRPSAAATSTSTAAAAPATRHRRRHEPVRLKASDFDSLVSLCDTVAAALIERASKNIYYAQSRSAVVSACAAINSFPSVIQLAYYTIAVGALYVFSMIAVLGTKNIDRMVAGCDAGLNRTTEVGNQTAIASNAEHDYLSSTFVTGAFLLLGFRLMNASAQATSALIFVKTIRGLYQRYSGLYGLTLQQRIPLMVLYANRPVQIVLTIYAIFILPFALAGPLYGGIFVDARCLVPIAIGAAILFIDFLVLSVARWISRRNIVIHDREKLQNLLDFSNDEINGEEAGNNDAGLLDNDGTSNNNTLLDAPTRTASSTTKEKEGGSNLMHDDDDDAMFEDFVVVKDDEDLISGTTHTKFTLQLPSSHQRNLEGESNYDDNKSGLKPLDKHVAAQTSVTSSAPVTLGKAIIVFMLTEEIPVLALSLALQVSMNYLCLLKFSYAFGIRDDPGRVYQTDYDGRTLECVWDSLTADANNAWEKISTVLSALSSFVPFM